MKKAVIITAVLLLIAGAGGSLWLKRRLDNQMALAATQEQQEEQPKQHKPAFDKYDNGPADPTELLELVNAERQRIGVAPLVMDENVQKSAQLKADDMIAKGYRQHDIPGLGDMYTQEMRYLIYQQAKCTMSGENYYTGAYYPKSDAFVSTSREAFKGWMSSKPHREAIQNPKYKKTGFGVSTNNTSLVAVQHFCIP